MLLPILNVVNLHVLRGYNAKSVANTARGIVSVNRNIEYMEYEKWSVLRDLGKKV